MTQPGMSRLNSPRPRRWPGPSTVLTGLLLVAIGMNVAGFASADRGEPPHWLAFHRFESADYAALIHRTGGLHSQPYEMHLALAELAPGSHVVMPDDGPLGNGLMAAQLYGIGQAARVSAAPVALSHAALAGVVPDALRSFDPTRFVVAQGPGGDFGLPWAIALGPPDPRPVDLRDPDGFLASLFASGRQGTIRGSARLLVLMFWPTGGDVDTNERLLLVEAALLPTEYTDGLLP